MARCWKCVNCLELQLVRRDVLSDVTHPDGNASQLLNRELERLPCLYPVDLKEILRPGGEAPWSQYKRELDSRLVVACNGGVGCILYAIGSCWEAWNGSSGSWRLDDNGLDDAPDGISIWEGRMQSWGPDRDGEYDAELRGAFRSLTEQEWAMLASGQAPWNEADWLK